ncbi:MAG TPA: hypothetical protein VKB80_26100 [Kofleriaceae bacterium]|nr:hypothetical protein [Kofleriaceae bacterium]
MRVAGILFAGILVVSQSACGGDDDDSADAADDADDGGDAGVAEFISGIDTGGDGTVAARSGALPAEGDGPAAAVTSAATVINGGTLQVHIEVAGAARAGSSERIGGGGFDRVVIAVSGVEGYFEVSLPEAVASLDLLITLSQSIGAADFAFLYAIGSADSIGAYQEVGASVVSVGTGDVQVSVSWDADSDVDLHVIDPAGDEVYFGMRDVASGGMLDLDSNPACFIDGVNNENITWATAPDGEYTVRVDYYAGCDVDETSYVVTVQRADHDAETFSGTLTGDGDSGRAGSGTDITTFTMP